MSPCTADPLRSQSSYASAATNQFSHGEKWLTNENIQKKAGRLVSFSQSAIEEKLFNSLDPTFWPQVLVTE
jgi:hypothetical protein